MIDPELAKPLGDGAHRCLFVTVTYEGKPFYTCGKVTQTEKGMRAHQRRIHGINVQAKLELAPVTKSQEESFLDLLLAWAERLRSDLNFLFRRKPPAGS